MFPERYLKTVLLFPFSVCSLCFDACRIISFSLKSSTYIRICTNVHEFSSSSKKDIVCPINVKNWALSENFLKWYVQIFFLLIYSVFFSKDTKNMLSHLCLSCPSCTIQSFFFHSFVCFLFILLIFSSLHSMSLIVFLSVSFLFCPNPRWLLLLCSLYFSHLGYSSTELYF